MEDVLSTSSVLSLLMIVATVGGALNGRGSQGLYFSLALTAGLCGMIAFIVKANPLEVVAATEAQRAGAAFLNDYAPPIALVLLATAFGSAVGGCVFRMPKEDE